MEVDETIRLTVPYANKQITAQYNDGDDVTLTVGSVDITLQDTGEGGAPSFATDASIADQTYAVGTAIADWVLPEASGGDGDLTYSVSPCRRVWSLTRPRGRLRVHRRQRPTVRLPSPTL